jgi:hypothetical protein
MDYLNPLSTTPQIIIGNPATGQGADDTAQAFRKYNAHTHRTYSPDDFRAYRISLGDRVYVYDEDDVSVFNIVDAPVITTLNKDYLIVSVTSTTNLSNTKLYVGSPKNSPDTPPIIIWGVQLTLGSNVISFNPDIDRAGFLDTRQVESLSSFQASQLFYLNSAQYPEEPDVEDLPAIVVHTPKVIAVRVLSVQLQFNGLGEGNFTLATYDPEQETTKILDNQALLATSEYTNRVYLDNPLDVITPEEDLRLLVNSLVLPENVYSAYLSVTFEFQRLIT